MESLEGKGVYDYLNSNELKTNRFRFKIEGGFLERVLEREHSDELRKSLVWKNFCYGSRRKHLIKKYTRRMGFTKPIQFLRPECYPALKDYVQFSKGIKAELEDLLRET